MAKLSGPLFSLEARQQLGKAIVYFPWKGINAARQYVVPTNPRSAAQLTQRGYMTNAVTDWHTLRPSAADITAWNRLANTFAKAMSGFNAFCQAFINETLDGGIWNTIRNMVTSAVGAATFTIDVDAADIGGVPTIHYGTSQTNMPNTQVMAADGVDHWNGSPAGLAADTLYYFYITYGIPGVQYGRTGIYQQRTTA